MIANNKSKKKRNTITKNVPIKSRVSFSPTFLTNIFLKFSKTDRQLGRNINIGKAMINNNLCARSIDLYRGVFQGARTYCNTIKRPRSKGFPHSGQIESVNPVRQ